MLRNPSNVAVDFRASKGKSSESLEIEDSEVIQIKERFEL